MSKKLNGLECKIKINDMDKSTSLVKGVLTFINKVNKAIKVDTCTLDVYVVSKGVRPILLHSYDIEVNESIEVGKEKSIDIELNGIVLSSLASEIIDLELQIRGTMGKCIMNVTRTEYIDYIEAEFSRYGFELCDYAVDVKNKMLTKLFRQYYVYSRYIDGEIVKFKVTYTPYEGYIRMCLYHNNIKTRTNLTFTDIKSESAIKTKIVDIFNEHKISYIENVNQ